MSKRYTFTTREKALIIFLFIVLVGFASVYYLFKPLNEEQTEAASELAGARVRRSQATKQMGEISNLDATVMVLTQELEAAREKYLPPMPVEALESEFTEFLLNNNIKPVSIRITPEPTLEEGEFVAFTLVINGTGELDRLLRLADYIHSVYSYELKNMSIQEGAEVNGVFTVRAVLLNKGFRIE